MRNSGLKWMGMITLMISLFACDPAVIFEENVRLPDNRWEAGKPIELPVEISDTSVPYSIYINVRNASGYQFRNLFLFLETITPSGKRSRDTVELMLADASGKWLGDGLGDIWDNRVLFRNNFRFPEPGVYTFRMEQAMRVDPLLQIMDAGIRIEKEE